MLILLTSEKNNTDYLQRSVTMSYLEPPHLSQFLNRNLVKKTVLEQPNY